ncbi:hypothetical protein KQI68_06635 [Peptoniphilus sp. MSJ-1]|uniref:Uncharacterized protein n=1 Tax=Peptoniphilus ovalis TaxID=2841503 RepID=A0ABS6FHN7_9FIRM|nr:hypothetical protein [Peptoniphilus ovalis]MBU5669514.1 hypothetical protein [Peptoniphilus ovalis]
MENKENKKKVTRPTVKETKKEEPKVEKSKKLISFNEFFTTYPLRAEYKARLKMELDQDIYKPREEWLKIVRQFEENI